ncbi:15627_t:CDS:10, partial [Funneliformis caledonium]
EEKLRKSLTTIKDERNTIYQKKAKSLLDNFEPWTQSINCERYWLDVETSLGRVCLDFVRYWLDVETSLGRLAHEVTGRILAGEILVNQDHDDESGSNSPLHDEFVKEIYETEEDYSDLESVNDNNNDDPDYVYSPSSSCDETKVTKSARKLNSDEKTPSVSPAKRTKLNEDTILDVVSDLNESASFNYGLRNYEEGIIIDPELALQETDEESVPVYEHLFDKNTWKKWKLKSDAIVADLLDQFVYKKGHPLRYTRRATISNHTETISSLQRQRSLESLGQSIEEIRLLNNIHEIVKDEDVRKLLLESLKCVPGVFCDTTIRCIGIRLRRLRYTSFTASCNFQFREEHTLSYLKRSTIEVGHLEMSGGYRHKDLPRST